MRQSQPDSEEAKLISRAPPGTAGACGILIYRVDTNRPGVESEFE
mgnify:CR=1 FL=1